MKTCYRFFFGFIILLCFVEAKSQSPNVYQWVYNIKSTGEESPFMLHTNNMIGGIDNFGNTFISGIFFDSLFWD